MSEPLLVAAGHEARARRAAIGTRSVPIREADAVHGQGIDVRRGNILAGLTAQFGVAKIIGHDNEDIWRAWGGRRLSSISPHRCSSALISRDKAENEECDERYRAQHF